jgi:membrane-bound metal-dependent hydrolase YbcI (DUF457 family)
MMGRTHALGGAAGLAAIAVVSGEVGTIPIWAYGWAAVCALLPDADANGSAMVDWMRFLPLKILTVPLWIKSPVHRQRTHSLFGTAFFALIIAAWILLFNILTAGSGHPVNLPLVLIVGTGTAGYFSHVALDILNLPGVWLFWPVPVWIMFPPWRAHKVGFIPIPGRFAVQTGWEGLLWLIMLVFCGWFFIQYASLIFSATRGDSTLNGLVSGLVGLTVEGVRGLLGLLKTGK